MMPSQSTHRVKYLVVRNVGSLANCQNQQKHGPSGNSQLPPAKRHVSEPAGERDSSQGGSSRSSTIEGQNSTPSSSLNNPCVADITTSATQRWSMILQPPRRVQVVVTDQHPVEPHRQTQGIALYPAPHQALLALPLLSVVLTTCLPPSLIQKPARSLQIHCERDLQRAIRDRGCGNCNRTRCLHLDQCSPGVAAILDLVTPTQRILYLSSADSWSSTCGTDGRV